MTAAQNAFNHNFEKARTKNGHKKYEIANWFIGRKHFSMSNSAENVKSEKQRENFKQILVYLCYIPCMI